MSLRVLVVDDTAVFRKLISEALTGIPDVEVCGTASNGKLALARIETIRPNLVTLDMEMPEMNGLETLEAISKMAAAPGVIMLSSGTSRGTQATMKALELGAFDFVAKPEAGDEETTLLKLRSALAPRLVAFARQREIRQMLSHTYRRETAGMEVGCGTAELRMPPETASPQQRPGTRASLARTLHAGMKFSGPPLVLMGVSTGGPRALAEVLPAIPADLGAPILIVQHMPPLFTAALAQSLQAKCQLRVKEAEDGEAPVAGCVYLAPGGRHMTLMASPLGKALIRLCDLPPEHGCRPAVDVLFRSVANAFPQRSIAVILTGMGSDGTAGVRELKRSGCISIAQDEATSTVFGMPRELIRAGIADHVVPLSRVAAEIVRQVRDAK